MTNKVTLEELMIRVMPGGFLLAAVYFVFRNDLQLYIAVEFDFLYTIVFFCSAFIVGELLQTLTHELEWIVDLFFRCRRPSQVFLYKNNPVLKNEYTRDSIFDKLELTKKECEIFSKEYSELKILPWNKDKNDDDFSQRIFWRCYSQVCDLPAIITSNRNYLFVRVMMMVFLILSILLFIDNSILSGIIGIIFSILFLWRSRGMARGLVFKTVLLSMEGKKSE